MRRRVLLRSVQRLLPTETVLAVAMLWSLHPHVVPIAAAAVVVTSALGLIAGAEPITIALVAAATAAATAGLTREYRVLAMTDEGFVIMRGSTIRLRATEVLERLPLDVRFRRAGGSLLTAEWQIAERTYTVRREWQKAMERMAAAASGDD